MSRTLLVLLLFVAGIAVSCKKSDNTLTDVASINAQLRTDTLAILQYIKENGLEGQFKRVADTIGVYYQIKAPGTGNAIFTNSTLVTVGDTARLMSTGKVFSETDQFHPAYIISEVIRGWQVSIPFLKPNGTIRVLVPSHYAYGPYPQADLGLPANAILDFDITLYAVTN